MKLSTEHQEATFKPITLNITFESREELYSLWNRMILSNNSVEGVLGCNTKTVSDAVSLRLFAWLEDEIKKIDE